MSLNKSTTRRLSLMAGSSLVAASLTVFSAVALAPTAANAQATCTSGTAITGNGTNAVTIAGGTNNPGVTCAYVGDNALVSTLAATTVSSAAPGGGINLSAAGDDSINWNSAAGTVTGSTQTNGPVIDALTHTGDINISTSGVVGAAATVTHGIRAISSGGDIVITTGFGTGTTAALTVSATNATSGQYGIEAATTDGGDVSITANGVVNGRLRSILASSSGTGRTNLILNGNTQGGGVEVSSGTGGYYVEVNGGSTSTTQNPLVSASGPAGGEIRIGATGNLKTAITAVAAGTIAEVNVEGQFGLSANNNGMTHTATGTGEVLVTLSGPSAAMTGRVDYSDLTGGATIMIDSRRPASGTATRGWTMTSGSAGGLSQLSQGDDQLIISETGFLGTTPGSVTLDFLSGDNVMKNAGAIVLGATSDTTPGSLTIENLGSFTNSGSIILGCCSSGFQISPGAAEQFNDLPSDIYIHHTLVLRNSRFIGEEGSRIFFSAILGATTQTSCAVQMAADCVDFQGTTTEGQTLVRVRDVSSSFEGFRNDGIVLIDVAGGSSSADHFELDPDSIGYDEDAALGPIIRKGLIAYDLIYDEDTQQHLLVGVVAPEAYQFQVLPSLALNTWRTATGTWFDRQADLRDTLGGPGFSKGMWARAAADFTTRDLAADFVLRGDTRTFDQSHEQKTGSLVVGADLVSAESQNHGYIVGAMLGFSNSVTEFDASPTKVEFSGPTGGVYASYVGGPLFLDGVVNASLLNMNQDSPGLNLGEGVRLKQDVTVVGAQLEGGWRMQFGGGFFAEPLAAFSWVRTEFEDIDDAAANSLVDFDDKAVSRRAALGLRVGMDSTLGPARAKYSLTGRAWNEFEGENRMVLELPGETMAMSDDLSGTFGEVGAGVSLSDDTGLISGFLNGNVKFQDDYRSAGFSAGVRLRW